MFSKVVSILCISLVASQAQAENPMVDMMMTMAKKTGSLRPGAECLGINEQKFEDLVRASMEVCFEDVASMSDETKSQECMARQMTKRSGKSREQFEACHDESERQGSGDDFDAALSQEAQALEDLYDALGDEEPSKEQYAQIRALEKTVAANRAREVKEMLDVQMEMLQQLSKGTEDKITLPVYPQSRIVVHMTEQMQIAGNASLPAATFASDDSIERVVSYYKKALPGFSVQKLVGGEYIFMQDIPEGFDILNNIDLYTSKPHVMLIPVADRLRDAMKASTTIEIAYQP